MEVPSQVLVSSSTNWVFQVSKQLGKQDALYGDDMVSVAAVYSHTTPLL